ncbi:Peptide methionine sulfoxide reductase MsrB [Planctomycetes bacterium MalM25]|nr:Peptide methionine sulfoxide reductase MsrB [Planctomycetes bacterium MalM25]
MIRLITTLALLALLGATVTYADEPKPLPADTDWKSVDWKARLTAEQFRVARQAGTERPFTNPYWDNKKAGEYRCVCCDLPLYSSEAKYKSGTGWPSFFQPIKKDAVAEHEDKGWFTTRTEIRCARCDAHLGHVFPDGPRPTGMRYCMNSAAMRFVEAKKADQAASEVSPAVTSERK